MDLKLELILIGDELLSGHKKDANLAQLTNILSSKGLKLSYVQIVGDCPAAIQAAFQLSSQRSECILTSGGLGPTLDDLTKEALAKTFNLPINFSKQAEDITLAHYQRLQRECNFSVNRYNLLPDDCLALNNPVGFAPGIFYQDRNKKFQFLLAPGVPREFKAIVNEHLDSLLQNCSNYKTRMNLQWRTFGIAEEKIFSELAPTLWQDLQQFGNVSSLPHLSGVDIRLSVLQNIDPQELDKIHNIIHHSGLTPYIWTTEDITLPEYIVGLAKDLKINFGFIESCTGGMASHLITQVPGCSSVFKGSLVTYQTELKNQLLHIDPSMTGTSGVNEETVIAMSRNGRTLLDCNWCVAFTGFAGPTGGDQEQPVGRLWLSIAHQSNQLSKKLDFIGTRSDRIERFTYAGLHFLRQELEKLLNS